MGIAKDITDLVIYIHWQLGTLTLLI
ncbi:hypothetical protein DSUL_50115 [Desulfovibrionales bacterium]